MDTIDLKSLPRRVGRMTYEQVSALFDENKQKLDAHNQAVDRDEFCSKCKWHIERQHAKCADFDTLPLLQIHLHRKSCTTCSTVVQEWKHMDSCEYMSELLERYRIYARRMDYLDRKNKEEETDN